MNESSEKMKTTLLKIILLSSMLMNGCQSQKFSSVLPTVSPDYEFLSSPENITAHLNDIVTLKCKLRSEVKSCEWYYLKPGVDFTTEGLKSAIRVSARPPMGQGTDCSIQFQKLQKVQVGQWICTALKLTTNDQIISKPGSISVIPKDAHDTDVEVFDPPTTKTPKPSTEEEEETPPTEREFKFRNSENANIINANLGDRKEIHCETTTPMQNCNWVKPQSTKVRVTEGNYEIDGDWTKGHCILIIKNVTIGDEGNWRCTVKTSSSVGELLGPLTHVHVYEFGPDDHHKHAGGMFPIPKNFSLILILVGTSFVLLLIVMCLVVFLCKRKAWRRQPDHKYYEASRQNSEYSNYSGRGSWLQGKDPRLLSLHSEQGSVQYEDPSRMNDRRYLDMSRNASGTSTGFLPLPNLPVTPTISVHTLGPAPSIPQNVGNNLRRNKSDQNISLNTTTGNASFGGNSERDRTPSLDSNSHLYEDIDEFARKRLNQEEDTEGYMVPTRRSRLPTPPLSSTPERSAANSYSNLEDLSTSEQHRDSGFDPAEEDSRSTNSPPILPEREDSARDSPLANYDVPKSLENIAV